MKFYATFTQRSPLRDNFVEIKAADREKAREAMHNHFADRWAFLYSQDEFDGQPAKYGLTELSHSIIADN